MCFPSFPDIDIHWSNQVHVVWNILWEKAREGEGILLLCVDLLRIPSRSQAQVHLQFTLYEWLQKVPSFL
jgi:hypothetical protein